MTDFTPEIRIGEPIETPSQTIVADAFAPVSVKDATGRAIEVMRLKPSERFQVKRMMGAEAENGSLFNDIFLVCHCRGIDGERVSKPTSILQALVLMDRLQDEGLKTLDEVVAPMYGVGKGGSTEQTAKN
ncbi:hypothetical protein [Methylovirgula sp. 4M-Z18]|uniref:hypothetical protein n=1 Tax=Methylovirgula sp. 4M-Z18 TaxID=2293567 RepID=UPI000E2EBD6D|nr:hypothetical protein [Methylovirgula sp. 4M-Z18]RFB80012.1 hypothetical protein DYH55_00215 [Methylovirgula sp. 4M-Z18]